jgi:diguanylate cyclase (GGDEF)-like protein
MEKIATLYHATHAVLSTFDLDEVLMQMLKVVREQFHIANASVLLLDESGKVLHSRQFIGDLHTIRQLPIEIGTGLIGSAVQLKEVVYAPDVKQDGRYVAGSLRTQSELVIPLIVRGEVVGVLDVQSTELSAFDEATVGLITLFATQASIAIENARLYSLEKRRAMQLEALNTIARQTTTTLEVDVLLPRVCTLVLEDFPVRNVAVFLAEEDRLHLRSQAGVSRVLSTVPAQSSLVAHAWNTGKIALENDFAMVPEVTPVFFGAQAELCLPLIYNGEKLGVLALENDMAGAFADPELGVLTSVADIFAGAIKNCRQFEAAKELAFVDGLTHVHNRRFFEEHIAAELDRCVRYDSEIALLMVDIDEFKTVNDDFGHMQGDMALCQIAALFQKQLRKSDLVCRYGGEEFVILLPELNRTYAVEVAEKLRRMVQQHSFVGVPRSLTISIGIAHAPDNGITRDDLIASADAALYVAKGNGRNSVVVAPAVMSQ